MPNIQAVIIGAILTAFIGFGVVIFIQHQKLVVAQEKYDQLLKNSMALEIENNDWKVISDNQNKKFSELKAAQTAKNVAMAKALSASKKEYDRLAALAATIEAQKTTGDDCAGASTIKNFYLKNRP